MNAHRLIEYDSNGECVATLWFESRELAERMAKENPADTMVAYRIVAELDVPSFAVLRDV